MKKIPSAKDILAAKGVAQSKFDTNGFASAVADYFMANEVSARLLLLSVRFVDIYTGKNDPCQVVTLADLNKLSAEDIEDFDRMDAEYIEYDENLQRDPATFNPYKIDWKERLRGFKVQTERNKHGDLLFVEQLEQGAVYSEWTEEFLRKQHKAGLIRPRILVNEPFLKNAAFTLQIMFGYTIKQLSQTTYEVMLPG